MLLARRTWWLRRKLKRIYHQQFSAEDDYTIRWAGDGLSVSSPVASASLAWDRLLTFLWARA